MKRKITMALALSLILASMPTMTTKAETITILHPEEYHYEEREVYDPWTETIHVDPVYETRVDNHTEPWTETIDHPPIYKTVVIKEAWREEFFREDGTKEYIDHPAVTRDECDVEAWTETIEHEAGPYEYQVLVSEGYEETIEHDYKTVTVKVVDKEAWTEYVTTAESQATAEIKINGATYATPSKSIEVQAERVNIDGSKTEISVYSDGSVKEKTNITSSIISSITVDSSYPTAVKNASIVVDKPNAKVRGKADITAVVGAATANGRVNITPQLVSGLKAGASRCANDDKAVAEMGIKIDTVDEKGDSYSVCLSTADLKKNAELSVYTVEIIKGAVEDNSYAVVSTSEASYSVDKGLLVSNLEGGHTYVVVNEKNKNIIENQIMNTVELSDDFKNVVNVSSGQTLDMSGALSKELLESNIENVEYSLLSGSNVTIDPTTGVFTINNDAKGTAIVSIKITLKNGKTKTLNPKIRIS